MGELQEEFKLGAFDSILKSIRTGFPKMTKEELFPQISSLPTTTPAATTSMGAGYKLVSCAGRAPKSSFSFSGGHLDESSVVKILSTDNTSYSKGATKNGVTKRVSFIHTGSAFELQFQNNTSNTFYLKVDGKYITTAPISLTTVQEFYHVDFGSSDTRRIDVIAAGTGLTDFQLQFIAFGATDTLMRAPVRGPRCILFGDSFGTSPNSFPMYFAEAMGWDDVWGSGLSGTGYIADSGDTEYTFRERLQSDAAQYEPQVFGFCGGVNDNGQSYSVLYAECLATFHLAKQLMPNALIFASPNSDRGPGNWASSGNAIAAQAAIRQAAADAEILMVDCLRQPSSGNIPSSLALQFDGTAGNANAVINYSWGTYDTTEGRWGDGCTVIIGSEADEIAGNAETFNVNSSQQSGAYTRLNFDGVLQNTIPAGTPVRLVGASYIVGTGYDTAATAEGNSDLLVSSDGLHPTDDGHFAFGVAIASNLVSAILQQQP